MHPAVTLTVTLFMTLMIGMPMVGWLLSRHLQADRNARIWFLAIMLDSLQVPLIALRGTDDAWWALVLPGSIPVMFYLTLCTVLRRELAWDISRPWLRVVQAGVLYVFFATFVYMARADRAFEIALLNNLVFVGFASLLTLNSTRLARQTHSRGMAFVALGFFVSVLGYVVRAWAHIVEGVPTPLFGFTWVGNFQVWTVAINLFLMTFGYLGFVLEKAEAEKIRLAADAAEAETRELVANQYNQQLLDLVAERDQMVMLNSRFATLGALATFNSAIVHEISQPLQAVMMCLENLREQDQAQGATLAPEIADSIALTNKVGDIVVALRNMMATGNALTEKTDVLAAIHAILPVIRSEARRRSVQIEVDLPEQPMYCDCSMVLFQRLMFNLVANAFDAFAEGRTGNPVLRVQMTQGVIDGGPGVSISFTDNGPGMSDEALEALFQPFNTHKATGLGIGLTLADILLRKWRGRILASHAPGGGLCFVILLPLYPVV